MAKKFNTHNETEMRLVNVLAHGEGLIDRDEFVRLSNKTMLSRYKSEGYIQEARNAGKGVYEITERFKREYCAQLDPFHRFSGSHSPTHSAGVNRVLSYLPSGVHIQTGSEIQAEFTTLLQASSHPAYNRVSEILYLCREHLAETKLALESAKTDVERAALTAEADRLNARCARLMNVKERWSTPDLRVTLERDQLKELLDRAEEHYQSYHCSDFQKYFYDLGIKRMMELYASGEREITLNIEITTSNYDWMDVDAKEVWSECCNTTPIIYIAA